jgi:hypothetical protein
MLGHGIHQQHLMAGTGQMRAQRAANGASTPND